MKKGYKQIEIEHRSRFSKKVYNSLLNFLEKEGKDLGQDDKNVYFFTFPDKLLKVTDNISKQTAKITGKLTRIGHGSNFEEIEIPINQSDVGKAVRLLKKFGFADVHNTYQKRHNYLYKGIEIAVKYSKVWGYHAEFEIMISDLKEKTNADKKIQSLAKQLEIRLMTEDELKRFIDRKEKEINKSKSKN